MSNRAAFATTIVCLCTACVSPLTITAPSTAPAAGGSAPQYEDAETAADTARAKKQREDDDAATAANEQKEKAALAIVEGRPAAAQAAKEKAEAAAAKDQVESCAADFPARLQSRRAALADWRSRAPACKREKMVVDWIEANCTVEDTRGLKWIDGVLRHVGNESERKCPAAGRPKEIGAIATEWWDAHQWEPQCRVYSGRDVDPRDEWCAKHDPVNLTGMDL